MTKPTFYISLLFVVLVFLAMFNLPAHASPSKYFLVKKYLESKKAQKAIPKDLSVLVTASNYQQLLTKTRTFLTKYAPGTPVKAELIVNLARDNKFPLDLLLIQGHIESNWCTKGRATTSNMCINVGSYDRGDTIATTCHDGTTWCVSDFAVGLQIYIDIMSKCWFTPTQAITIDNFIKNDFRIQQRGDSRCGAVGGRYATSPAYQNHFVNTTQNLFNPIFK